MCSRSEPETSISSSSGRVRCGRPRRASIVISPVRVAWRSVRRTSIEPRRCGRRRRERIFGRCSSSARRSSRRSSASPSNARWWRRSWTLALLPGALGAAPPARARRRPAAPAPRSRPPPAAPAAGGAPRKYVANTASKKGMSSQAGDERHARQPVQPRDVVRRVVAQRGEEVDAPLRADAERRDEGSQSSERRPQVQSRVATSSRAQHGLGVLRLLHQQAQRPPQRGRPRRSLIGEQFGGLRPTRSSRRCRAA